MLINSGMCVYLGGKNILSNLSFLAVDSSFLSERRLAA